MRYATILISEGQWGTLDTLNGTVHRTGYVSEDAARDAAREASEADPVSRTIARLFYIRDRALVRMDQVPSAILPADVADTAAARIHGLVLTLNGSERAHVRSLAASLIRDVANHPKVPHGTSEALVAAYPV